MPGDELFALAVAANPFKLAAIRPVLRNRRGRGEFDGAVWAASEKLIDRRNIGLVVIEIGRTSPRSARRSGSMCQASTPSKSITVTSVCTNSRRGVDRGEVGHDGIEIDADGRSAFGER